MIITEQIIVVMIMTVILTTSNQTNWVPLVFTLLSNSRTLKILNLQNNNLANPTAQMRHVADAVTGADETDIDNDGMGE